MNVSKSSRIIYVLGMPFLALTMLFMNRHHLETSQVKYRWGVLYVGLRPERYYWDFVIALRKAAFKVGGNRTWEG